VAARVYKIAIASTAKAMNELVGIIILLVVSTVHHRSQRFFGFIHNNFASTLVHVTGTISSPFLRSSSRSPSCCTSPSSPGMNYSGCVCHTRRVRLLLVFFRQDETRWDEPYAIVTPYPSMSSILVLSTIPGGLHKEFIDVK
jgi:hypothetical protein